MTTWEDERADQHTDACHAWDHARTVMEDAHRLQDMLEAVKEAAFAVEAATTVGAALERAADMRAAMASVTEEVSGWL